jgi:hypothetical protein
MYSLADLKRAAANPHVIPREINRLYHTRFWTRQYNPNGIDVISEDWDNLIILDACRYETFAKEADLPGQLECRESRAGATPEFVRANFSGKTLHDTVYITGNSWYFKLRDEIDAELHAVEQANYRKPGPVTDQALNAASEYPNKRLIVHFIPPHHPFVGPTANEYLPEYDDQLDGFFEQINRGDLNVSDDVLRRAYVENLERVLPEVEKLLNEFNGRTVVTADHGELLGDRSSPIPMLDYGHHSGLYVAPLVDIPWLTHNTGERRRIIDEPPTDDETVDEQTVDERLRQLGYRV